MASYSDECLETFLKEQGRLFDEEVASNPEEAEAFLEECLAVVVDDAEGVRDYFEEVGLDVAHMTLDEMLEASEVFALPNGQYLIVEG